MTVKDGLIDMFIYLSHDPEQTIFFHH